MYLAWVAGGPKAYAHAVNHRHSNRHTHKHIRHEVHWCFFNVPTVMQEPHRHRIKYHQKNRNNSVSGNACNKSPTGINSTLNNRTAIIVCKFITCYWTKWVSHRMGRIVRRWPKREQFVLANEQKSHIDEMGMLCVCRQAHHHNMISGKQKMKENRIVQKNMLLLLMLLLCYAHWQLNVMQATSINKQQASIYTRTYIFLSIILLWSKASAHTTRARAPHISTPTMSDW